MGAFDWWLRVALVCVIGDSADRHGGYPPLVA